MIRDEQTARAAMDALEKARQLLVDSVDMVKNRCTDEEYKAYHRGVAQVIARIFFLVMEPIYREHPSLAPPDTPQEFLDAWKTAASKKQDSGPT